MEFGEVFDDDDKVDVLNLEEIVDDDRTEELIFREEIDEEVEVNAMAEVAAPSRE